MVWHTTAMGGRSAPTVPKWYIGRELQRLRDAAGMTREQAADIIHKSKDTVRNVEIGETAADHANLDKLLDAYQADEEVRHELLDLNEAARKRGWWVPYAPTTQLAMLLGAESVATEIVSHDPFMLPGILQTYAYASALYEHTAPYAEAEARDRSARLRPERYRAVFERDPAATVTAYVDETALRREVAAPDVMVEQLERVLAAPCEVRIVPSRAVHPGVSTLALLSTSEIGLVAHVEGWRDGEILLDAEDDVAAVSKSLREIERVALPVAESREMIKDAAEEWRQR